MSSVSIHPAGAETEAQPPTRHHEFVILGGGTAGVTVAAKLCRQLDGADVAIVEPSEDHFYQPFWTLVGAGVVSKEASRKPELDFTPNGANWIRDSVSGFDPSANTVTLASGEQVSYGYLIVAIGLQVNWRAIKGLEGNLGHDGIVSNYAFDQCEQDLGGAAVLQGRRRHVHDAPAADQVRGCAAEDHVPRRRPAPHARGPRQVTRALLLGDAGDLLGQGVREDAQRGDRSQGDRDALQAQPRRGAPGQPRGGLSRTSSPASRSFSTTTCCTSRRRRARRRSSSTARSRTRPAGSTSTSTPCATRTTRTCSRSATSRACRRPRPARRSARRRRSWCNNMLAVREGKDESASRATTATRPAR